MAPPHDLDRNPLAGKELTSAALIHLDYLPPPPELAPFITTYFVFRCDEPRIADIQPAGVGILAVFMQGRGEMFFRDGRVDPSHLVNVMTPLAAAAPVLVEGPWHAFGAALSPLGWAALTGCLSAAEHGNRLRDAGELIHPSLHAMGQAMAADYNAGRLSPADCAAMMSAALGPLLRDVPAAHVALMGRVADWLGQSLSPRVDDLARNALYSARQLQRLVDQYFGLPPKQLARKYRALRAAALLADPALPADQVALVQDQFYDQSHMIREMRLFAGRTPARLGASDQPMLSALLDLRNFREITPRVAVIPGEFDPRI
jgi:AraC-like DNA-binding protein